MVLATLKFPNLERALIMASPSLMNSSDMLFTTVGFSHISNLTAASSSSLMMENCHCRLRGGGEKIMPLVLSWPCDCTTGDIILSIFWEGPCHQGDSSLILFSVTETCHCDVMVRSLTGWNAFQPLFFWRFSSVLWQCSSVYHPLACSRFPSFPSWLPCGVLFCFVLLCFCFVCVCCLFVCFNSFYFSFLFACCLFFVAIYLLFVLFLTVVVLFICLLVWFLL